MELYTLNALFQREEVIDVFESCIWAERFKTKGDFELVIPSTNRNRSLLKEGGRLASNESFYVMEIETVEDKTDADGKRMLSVKGSSLEGILESRIAKASMDNLTDDPKWTIIGLPTDIARTIFHQICVVGVLSPADVIPFVNDSTTFMPIDTILEPEDEITSEIEPTTVYQAIKNLADIWQFGFRLLRHFDTSQLYFDIYMGSDRTSAQVALPAVIFASELDNLQNTSSLNTIAGAKNVAYVFSPTGSQVVVADGVDPDVDGFDRRVLVVNASDITVDNPDVTAALIQRGKEELSKVRTISAFDGEIDQYTSYRYGIDYNLGDIVEQRNTDGIISYMRVTEQIFVSDANGDRSYPTLELNAFINPGSWPTYGTMVWADFTDADHWADL